MARNMRTCPALRSAALLVVACFVVASGCRTSQQTALPNPFLSADRVPAPGSRVPAAGTAQPYYPGQAMPPLPATQQTQPAFQNQLQPLGALPPSSDITPIPADGAFAASGSSSVIQPPSDAGSLASDGGGIRIPSDDQTMRFAVTPPTPATTTNPAPFNPTAPASTLAAQPARTMQPVAVASRTPQPTPTSFRDDRPAPTAPVINNWPPAASSPLQVRSSSPQVNNSAPQVTMSPVSNTGRASGLFRDPQVPAQAPPLFNTASPHTISQPGFQPTGQPAASPRIRMPGAGGMIREEVVPGSINTTSYQVGMAGGVPGQPMVVPPTGFVPNSFTPDPSARPISDGFRPQGSSRHKGSGGSINPNIPTLRVTPG